MGINEIIKQAETLVRQLRQIQAQADKKPKPRKRKQLVDKFKTKLV